MLHYVIERLREPSTYAGLAGILAALHINLDPGLWQHIVEAALGLSSLAAFLLGERSA